MLPLQNQPSALSSVSMEEVEALYVRALYARRRYQMYRVKAYQQWPTSPVRMRDFQRACEQADADLRTLSADQPHPD